MKKAYHGGDFFQGVGEDFSTLEKSEHIINADVLDAWFDPSPKALDKIREHLPFIIRTSPPNYSEGLIDTISNVRGIPKANILTGGGSSDLIFTFFPKTVRKGDKVLILDPMYGEYQHILENVIEANVVRFFLKKEDDFKINTDLLIESIVKNNPKMIAIVNPNSPTGQYFPKEDILKILKSIPPNTLFIIDETYIEYVDKSFSLEKNVLDFENLVIIKSMSKVYALSGARVAYIVASQSIIDELGSFVPPWAVSLVGQMAGVEALKDEKYYREKYQETHRLREEMVDQLAKNKLIKIYPSVANFFLIELLDERLSAEEIAATLQKQNIYIRNTESMSSQFSNKFLRTAVKNREANERVSSELTKCLTSGDAEGSS